MAPFGLGIVEADAAFGQKLVGFFQEHGIPAKLHDDLTSLLADLSARPPGMVVLGTGGEFAAALAMLRRIREMSRVPCILLVGQADARNEVLALEAGADGMIDRALPLRILLARIRAVLRRAEWGGAEEAPVVWADGWRLLPMRRQLLRPDGSECPLTSAEFDLLRLLMAARGMAVSREAVSRAVFRRPFRAEDRTVDNLVLRLRRKLGPGQENSIKTVRGAGYMFGGFAEDGLRVA